MRGSPSRRFFDSLGNAKRGAGQASGGSSSVDVDDKPRLSSFLKEVAVRLTRVELRMSPPQVDFEINCGTAGAKSYIRHGFGAPVRWYVVHWGRQDGASLPTAAPALVMDTSSDTNTLVLNSYVSGKAVIRVEPSPFAVST